MSRRRARDHFGGIGVSAISPVSTGGVRVVGGGWAMSRLGSPRGGGGAALGQMALGGGKRRGGRPARRPAAAGHRGRQRPRAGLGGGGGSAGWRASRSRRSWRP